MKPLSSFQTKTQQKPLSAFAEQPEKATETYGATFPASKSDTPLKAGLKAAGNLPSSLIDFTKGVVGAAAHPLTTSRALFNTAVGGVEKGLSAATGIDVQDDTTEQFDMLLGALKERYGSLENLQRTATNDPFGFGADILGVLEGGAATIGRSAQLTKGLTTVARKGVIEPVSAVAKGAGSTAGKTARFGVSQATGLNPETINEIVQNPSVFSRDAIKSASREDLASSVGKVIDDRLNSLKETGKGYEAVRKANVVVAVPEGSVQSVLDKYGIKVVDGKVKTTAETLPLSPSDKSALSDFLNVYGNEAQLSGNAFLNTRAALSELSRFEATRTGNLQKIARDLRSTYDDLGKNQIPGLKELDEAYAPEVKTLNQIKKDYLKPDGTFKDGAVSKLANLTGKGKEQTLARLEKIMPGVTQRVKILKAAEDIERASGLKVGTYTRSVGLGGGLMTGNVPLVVGAIISSPEIAVRLLRAYGFTKKTAAPVIQMLRGAANDVNNFRLPGLASQYVKSYIENPRVGMSIEDITKTKGFDPLITEARKYKSAEEFVNSMGRGQGGVGSGVEYSPLKRTVIEDGQVSLADILGKDEQITVYRGVDRASQSKIVDGDYVATSKDLAGSYAGTGKIINQKANLKDIYVDAGDLTKAELEKYLKDPANFHIEANYITKPVTKSQLTDIWKKANKK